MLYNNSFLRTIRCRTVQFVYYWKRWVGRVLPNFYADKIGALNLQIPFTFVASLLCFCWIAVKDTTAMIAWSVVYGFFCGCFASMPSSSVMSLTTDLGMMGSRMGMALAASGFGFLIGSPIGGALLSSQGGWTALKIWAALLLAIAGFFSVAARVMKTDLILRIKIQSTCTLLSYVGTLVDHII